MRDWEGGGGNLPHFTLLLTHPSTYRMVGTVVATWAGTQPHISLYFHVRIFSSFPKVFQGSHWLTFPKKILFFLTSWVVVGGSFNSDCIIHISHLSPLMFSWKISPPPSSRTHSQHLCEILRLITIETCSEKCIPLKKPWIVTTSCPDKMHIRMKPTTKTSLKGSLTDQQGTLWKVARWLALSLSLSFSRGGWGWRGRTWTRFDREVGEVNENYVSFWFDVGLQRRNRRGYRSEI